MNKGELIEAIAEKVGVAKAEADRMVNAFEEIVISTLKGGGEVVITGFGTFSAKKREARTGRNPQTGESIEIPAMTVPKFKAGKALKDALK
jgi:DNA-binding protein HU-beta